jgi:hypothetical protein
MMTLKDFSSSGSPVGLVMKETIMKPHRIALLSALCAAALASVSATAHADTTWSEISAGAAAGYCLARHPRIAPQGDNIFTSEGFEILSPPGIAGAVRRNYVFNRAPVDFSPGTDVGGQQTCPQACRQWGLEYGLDSGKTLRFRASPDGPIVNDGIGDMAATSHHDADFYLQEHRVVAGMSGRPMSFHEEDVAQADFCCCQIRDGE